MKKIAMIGAFLSAIGMNATAADQPAIPAPAGQAAVQQPATPATSNTGTSKPTVKTGKKAHKKSGPKAAAPKK